MNESIRKQILSMTIAIRKRLEGDILQQLESTYGMNADGTFVPVDKMPVMQKNPVLARERQDLEAAVEHEEKRSPHLDRAGALLQFAREVAFTYLNRLAALRMMEARQLIQPSINQGMDSSGFKMFQGLFGLITDSKETGYRRYLELLCDEAAVELPGLFDRSLPNSIVFPSPLALKDVLEELDRPELAEIWLEDETIGWIYQYFTPKEQRDQARKDSSAPRNSYELSFRNQFYTPNYVVKFLTDNTLGRLWCEMKPDSVLFERCEFLVTAPVEGSVRAKKKLTELKVLDPACGSGHFLLYAFDLLAAMYEEEGYDRSSIAALILKHNLYGVDIDLRATQITSLALYLKAKKYHPRSQVIATNIVCAEPMPGAEALFNEFLQTVTPPLLRTLAKSMWKELVLAPEAGTLLRTEQALLDSLEAAKVAHKESFFTSETPVSFWDDAETRLITLLNEYAGKALEDASASRKLFARNGREGLRFLEVLRTRFDVVLMNPPFGKASKGSKAYIDAYWPRTKNDLLATFVERGLSLLVPDGYLGAITSRTGFYLGSFETWRTEVLLKEASLQLLADLGDGVLDTAMVETACYTLKKSPSSNKAMFLRLLLDGDKATALRTVLQNPNDDRVFYRNPNEFRVLPSAPFVYWVSKPTAEKLTIHPSFEPTVGSVRVGLQTSDDPRFVRAIWEVDPSTLCGGPFTESALKLSESKFRTHVLQQLSNGRRWVFHVKAGASQPWYSPLTVVVDWENDGDRIRNFKDAEGKLLSRPQNTEYYFLPGFSWTRRAPRFIPYIVPRGCIPTVSRYQAFPHEGLTETAMVVSASKVASAYLRFYGEKFEWPNFLVDTVKSLPWPDLNAEIQGRMREFLEKAAATRQGVYRNYEPFQEFTLPSLCHEWGNPAALQWDKFSLIGSEMDEVVARAFGLSEGMMAELERDLREVVLRDAGQNVESNSDHEEPNEEELDESAVDTSQEARSAQLISYAIGVAFGRWDVRIAMDPSLAPALPSPAAPAPICPPGMLVGPDGLPAKPGQIASEQWIAARPDANTLPPGAFGGQLSIGEEDYPASVQWTGVIPQENGNPQDLSSLVRNVLHVMFPRDPNIEERVRAALEVSDLSEWISTKFFPWHVKCYTKSKRRAPIYWNLRSSRKSYGLWLYYHRLTRDTLYVALRDHVEPKLAHETNVLKALQETQARVRLEGGKAERTVAKQVAEQENLVQEIAAFRDEIKAVADAGYYPDLNDGVLINIAPLHKLVPWKDAATCYKDLKAGKYPWATMYKRYNFR